MKINKNDWQQAQTWEAAWWGDCTNTFGEEAKQWEYAKRMGLEQLADSQGPYFDVDEASILDMGGGAVSMLLKCRNRGHCAVVDPCAYPDWIAARYRAANIDYLRMPAEEVSFDSVFDEVWLYNVLQHVMDPEAIVRNCLKYGKIVRVFEWLEIGVGAGHPHNLTEDNLNKWLRGEGKVVPAYRGKEYFGIFKGDTYE